VSALQADPSGAEPEHCAGGVFHPSERNVRAGEFAVTMLKCLRHPGRGAIREKEAIKT
jgi:hypothetical protein